MKNKQYRNQKESTPTHSKSKTKRAGEAIRKDIRDKYDDSIRIIKDYRQTFAYPLTLIKNHASRMSTKVNPNRIIARRLKRLPTIIDKLTRPTLDGKTKNSICLTRMHDIGGCRVIVDTVDEVYQVLDNINKSKSVHKIHKAYDYIKQPKTSGYRGIHVVFDCFAGDKNGDSPWKGYKIELQIRTKLQHAWSTTVETLDLLQSTSLKTNVTVNDDKSKYFRLLSRLAQHIDDTHQLNDDEFLTYARQLEKIDAKHNLFDQILDYTMQIKSVGYSGAGINHLKGHFLIALLSNKEDDGLSVFKHYFSPHKTQLALSTYEKFEEYDKVKAVVLVAAQSVQSIKTAYPNYFADTYLFAEFYNNILRMHEKLLSKKVGELNKVKKE